MVRSQYGSVIFRRDGQLLIYRLASKFGKSIFMWALFVMCGIIRFIFQCIFNRWLFLSSSTIKVIRRLQSVLVEGAINVLTFFKLCKV